MSQCARCGALFSCGMADKVDGAVDAPCWCTEFPVIPAAALTALSGVDAAASCFCPACLRDAVLATPDLEKATGKIPD